MSKRFGPHWALGDVDFDIFENELLGLIGPNGSGKTTLLECVSGLLPSDSGTVSRETGLFYLPEGISPYREHWVAEILQLFQRMYGRDRDFVRHIVDQLTLTDVLGKRIGELSKGTLKRLLLALALITPEPLLLLDEPFDGLDLRQTRVAMSLLKDLRSAGRTLLLSIHQLSDAEKVCDRFLLLREGQWVGTGTLEELRQRAGLSTGNLEEVFLALT